MSKQEGINALLHQTEPILLQSRSACNKFSSVHRRKKAEGFIGKSLKKRLNIKDKMLRIPVLKFGSLLNVKSIKKSRHFEMIILRPFGLFDFPAVILLDSGKRPFYSLYKQKSRVRHSG